MGNYLVRKTQKKACFPLEGLLKHFFSIKGRKGSLKTWSTNCYETNIAKYWSKYSMVSDTNGQIYVVKKGL